MTGSTLKTTRRSALLGLGTAGLCAPAIAQARRTLALVATWPRGLPGLWDGADRFAKRVTAMSGGSLVVEAFAAGERVGAFDSFDAVGNGQADIYHGCEYYWEGRDKAYNFFTTVPFGFTAEEFDAWIRFGGGQELWDELAHQYNIQGFMCGNTGVQMGGWFNKAINSVEDLKGLKMRIPGLGGEVLRRAGGTAVALPGSEIFTSLQTGAIDATEWVGPYNDVAFGLHEAARYYYYPGWQEPGPGLETVINREAWESLPPDLQAILETACQAITTDMVAEYTHGNAFALKKLIDDPDIEVRRFPDDVLELFESITGDIVAEMIEGDPLAQRIADSYYAFLEVSRENQRVTEQAYLEARG